MTVIVTSARWKRKERRKTEPVLCDLSAALSGPRDRSTHLYTPTHRVRQLGYWAHTPMMIAVASIVRAEQVSFSNKNDSFFALRAVRMYRG